MPHDPDFSGFPVGVGFVDTTLNHLGQGFRLVDKDISQGLLADSGQLCKERDRDTPIFVKQEPIDLLLEFQLRQFWEVGGTVVHNLCFPRKTRTHALGVAPQPLGL